MSVLDELYAGNIRPAEQSYISEKYRAAQKKQGNYYNRLEQRLSKKERKILEKLWESTSDMEYEFGLKMFRTGLALGIRMSAEGFGEEAI